VKRVLPVWVRPRTVLVAGIGAAVLAVLPFFHSNRYWHNQIT